MPSMVDPAIYVSANLGDLNVTAKAMRALGVKRAAVVGHLVMLWGKAAQFAPGGILAEIADEQLENWAAWDGKRGRFAAWVRAEHLDASGRPSEWEDYAGKLMVARELAREKKRRQRGTVPPSVPGTVPGTRTGTEPGPSPDLSRGLSTRAHERERERERKNKINTATTARERFLAVVPADKRTAWVAMLDGWTEGLGTPGGKAYPVEQVDAGLAEYLAAPGMLDFTPRHVVRFVEAAGRAERTGSVSGRGGTFADLVAATEEVV